VDGAGIPAPAANNGPAAGRWTGSQTVTSWLVAVRRAIFVVSRGVPGDPFPCHAEKATMSHSKDKDKSKMVKKQPLKTPKEKKEAKRLKKLERERV
jgi:hypothetical protein